MHIRHAPAGWWEQRWFLVLVTALAAVPLLYPPIPPLVDLFGHMGRYRVELDLGHSPWLQHYYGYHWAAIGNLGVDLLVMPLGQLIGLEPAVKLIVLAIPPLTAAGFLWVAREVHGRIPPTAFFALPFIYGYPFLFGFVNFALSVALAFLAFGLWLRLGRLERTRLRGLAVRADLARRLLHPHLRLGPARPDVLFGRGGAPARPRPVVVARRDRGRAARLGDGAADPDHAGLAQRNARRHDLIDWFDWKLKWRWIYSALRDRWKWFDIGSLIAAGLVFVYALVSRKLTLSRNLAFSAIVLAVLLRRAAADRVRLGLCRHAAGALFDRGRAPRDPLPRRAATGGRRTVLAVARPVFFVDADRRQRPSAWRSPPTTSRPSWRRSTACRRGARVITLIGMPCSEYLAAAAQQPSRRNGRSSGAKASPTTNG